MRHKDIIDSQPNGRRWHAWAPHYEVIDRYGPNGELLGYEEKRCYPDANWPAKRDVWNLLIGAIAVLVLQFLRSMPH